MWKFNVYFRHGENTIRCPVEAPNMVDAIKEACEIMRQPEFKVWKVQRGNKIC